VKGIQEAVLALVPGVGARRHMGLAATVVVIADRSKETGADFENGVTLDTSLAEEDWTCDLVGFDFPGIGGSFAVQGCAVSHSMKQPVAACFVPWG